MTRACYGKKGGEEGRWLVSEEDWRVESGMARAGERVAGRGCGVRKWGRRKELDVERRCAEWRDGD